MHTKSQECRNFYYFRLRTSGEDQRNHYECMLYRSLSYLMCANTRRDSLLMQFQDENVALKKNCIAVNTLHKTVRAEEDKTLPQRELLGLQKGSAPAPEPRDH